MPLKDEVSNFSMRLRVNDNVQIYKIEMEMNSDNFSLISLNKLKRNYEPIIDDNTLFSTDENLNEFQKNFSSSKNF